MAIILASASPRRQELLRQVGCEFTVMLSHIVEDNDQDVLPEELAIGHAREKALDVAARVSADDVVIGADTIVVLNGRVYGKPVDERDARNILAALSGKEHQVMTGIAVVKAGKLWTDVVITRVKIAEIGPEEVEQYLSTGEPMDKAGAYAIQGIGALLVEDIKGCYTNVVGLPLRKTAELLKKAGIILL